MFIFLCEKNALRRGLIKSQIGIGNLWRNLDPRIDIGKTKDFFDHIVFLKNGNGRSH